MGLLSIGVLTTGIMSVSAWSNHTTKQEILSHLTGKTKDQIEEERLQAKTYGEVAKNNQVLEEFKQENLESIKTTLQEKVEKGQITEEQKDRIVNNIEEHHANCDGTGNELHQGLGLGRGKD